MARAIGSGIGFGLLLVSVFAAAQNPAPSLIHLLHAGEEEAPRENPRDDEGLYRVIDRVASAFESGDAERLESCLVSGKVYLSLRARQDEAGYYGKSQVKFMFGKLFREQQTESFSYDSAQVEFSSSQSAYFRGDWSYAVPDGDDVVVERLRFKLDRGKSGWSVSEIRSQNR